MASRADGGGSDAQAEKIGRAILDALGSDVRVPRARGGAPGGRFGPVPLAVAIGILIGVVGAMLFVPDDADSGGARETSAAAAVSGASATGVGPAMVDGTTSGGTSYATTGGAASVPSAGVNTDPTAGRGAATTSGPAPAAPSGGSAAATSKPTKVRIGVAFSTGGEAIAGPIKASYEAMLDQMHKTGQLPVNGRDVEFVYRSFELTEGEAGMRSVCVELAQDDKVFAAIVWVYDLIAECLAREFKIPTIGVYFGSEAMRRAAPYLFATGASLDGEVRNAPHMAHHLGHLTGRKIGLFYAGTPEMKTLVEQGFKPQLESLGYKLLEAAADDGGASTAALAVQRFRAAGVDTVFIQSRPYDFSQAAEAQGWRPKYILFAGRAYQADGIAAYLGALPQQMDESLSIVATRVAETGTGGNPPPAPAGMQCQQNYERYSGRKARRDGSVTEQIEWQSIQHSCDQVRALVTALRTVGPSLTASTYIAGLESVKAQPSGFLADISWRAGDHFGGKSLKTTKFEGDCMCWKHDTPFRPFYVQ